MAKGKKSAEELLIDLRLMRRRHSAALVKNRELRWQLAVALVLAAGLKPISNVQENEYMLGLCGINGKV